MARPYPLSSRNDSDVNALGKGNPVSTNTIETASRGHRRAGSSVQAETPYRRLLLDPLFFAGGERL
jgi:hypothetical protein